MFDNRTYRRFHKKPGLVPFDVTVKETNLHIQADTDLSDTALRSILKYRGFIETFARVCPEFMTALVPLPLAGPAPAIVTDMFSAAGAADVGPMAAVAGAMSEYTGRDLLKESGEILVENGGDIFIKSNTDTTFAIFAGDSPLSLKAGLHIKKQSRAYAMCTSSGTIGHSKSFGRADAVTVYATSCPLADAMATALCNQVQSVKDIEPVIERGNQVAGILGIAIIMGEHIGLWGDMELVPL
ncbi:MAG: UPF0280 family protein [Desulfobacteraceae bacterium]|nr:MAG: UPF0280 family protein [Desulfobacteraceae bacterium]